MISQITKPLGYEKIYHGSLSLGLLVCVGLVDGLSAVLRISAVEYIKWLQCHHHLPRGGAW